MTSSREYDDTLRKQSDPASPLNETHALDPALRTKAEARLGGNLDGVHVHTGPSAQTEARLRNARALTRGRDIYFSRDAYNPGTVDGDRLLTHELAHTIQQSGDGARDAEHTVLEAEADSIADTVMHGEHCQVSLRAPHGATQLQEKGKTQAPTITRHPDEITPVPAGGAVTGAGISVAYHYTVVSAAQFVTLTLQLPDGVAAVVSPLTNLRERNTYRVQNAEGTRPRAVVVSVDKNMKQQPRIQVTFSRGNTSYLVIFQFPAGEGK